MGICDENAWLRVWPILISEIPLIIEAADVPVKKDSDSLEDALIGLEHGIQFNGVGHDGHETFLLGKHNICPIDIFLEGKKIPNINYCKTARKPYDLTVCLVLLRAKQLASDSFSLSSDGFWSEEAWREARKIYNLLWPEDEVNCPWAIKNERELPTKEESLPIQMRSTATPSDDRCKEIEHKEAQPITHDLQEAFHNVKQLLADCILNSNHTKCAHDELRWINLPGVALRLIDVCQGCLIDAPPNSSFVALSYVWGGKQNFTLTNETAERLTRHGSILSSGNIPLVISETIEVCKAMGERFLWVDSLCIRQDDARDKAIQILRMRDIFSSAKLTIVAAGSHDVNSHLWEPHAASKHRLSPHTIYENSTWKTRGWTFQEAVLSHRMLIFSPSGIYFQCQKQLCHIGEGFSMTTLIQNYKNEWSFLYNSSPGSELKAYFRAVEGYSGRNLTYQSDALTAFQGIIKSFSSSLDGLPNEFFYGLPTSSFDQAICWQTDQHCPHLRRPEYPSWSWLGWKQKSFLRSQPTLENRSAQMLYRPLINETILVLEDATPDGWSPLLDRQYNSRKPCLAGHETGRGKWAWGLPAATSLYHRQGTLNLWSSLARLIVSRVDVCHAETLHGSFTVMVDNLDKQVLGTINLDRRWRSGQPDMMPFIALDGKGGTEALILTKLMCLLPSDSCPDSHYYTRVQIMDCCIDEETWRSTKASIFRVRLH